MGEVYRARDIRLDRTVAIKVLTGALAADSESRQRFEQEARAIAALNDPHICTSTTSAATESSTTWCSSISKGRRSRTGCADRRGFRSMKRSRWRSRSASARPRAPSRHRPSRSEAGQRDAGASRRGRLVGLTRREAARLRTGRAHDPSGSRDASLEATIAPSMMATRPPTATASSAFSGTLQTWRPNSSMATRATTAPTSSPSAASSTRCSRDARRSRAPPPHGDCRDREQRAAANRRASIGASASRPRAEALPREGSRAAVAEHRRCHGRAPLDCQ